jgi:hypothetical protein
MGPINLNIVSNAKYMHIYCMYSFCEDTASMEINIPCSYIPELFYTICTRVLGTGLISVFNIV